MKIEVWSLTYINQLKKYYVNRSTLCCYTLCLANSNCSFIGTLNRDTTNHHGSRGFKTAEILRFKKTQSETLQFLQTSKLDLWYFAAL